MSDHKWLEAVLDAFEDDEQPVERRGSARCPFHREQRIAPYFGQGELFPTDFQIAFCIDISTTGMSFYWPRVPTFQTLVIRLGDAQDHIDVFADVRWHSRQPTASGYIIGCRFVGQVSD